MVTAISIGSITKTLFIPETESPLIIESAIMVTDKDLDLEFFKMK
jgi:hypothetical protein